MDGHTLEHPHLKPSDSHGPQGFATTRWSLILRAGGDAAASGVALEKLCATYWPPVYAWVRRNGHGRSESEDFTQEFFARLLGYGSIASAKPEKGRFRSFLLGALKHFLANEWHRANCQKRGGGRLPIALDALETYEREALEPRDQASPDKIFDRQWAETLLARAVDRLRGEYGSAQQLARFDMLKNYLHAGSDTVSYSDTAQALAISESAVKSAIFKLRQRYAEMVRHEVLQTLDDATQVEDELRCLLAALSV